MFLVRHIINSYISLISSLRSHWQQTTCHAVKITATSAMVFFLLLSTGCARQTSKAEQASLPQLSAGQYLSLGKQTQGEVAIAYNLQAIAILLQQQKISQAQFYLSKIKPQTLSKKLQADYYFYKARTTLLLDQYQTAINQFNTVLSPDIYEQLSQLQKRQVNQWLGEAYSEQNLLLPSLQYFDQALKLFPADSITLNQQLLREIWQTLLKQNLSGLQNTLSQATGNTERGWLQLSIIAKQKMPWDSFQADLKAWQQQYKSHPAEVFVKNKITTNAQVIPMPLKKVAVILPSDGPYAKDASAVKNGILAAYYYDLSHNTDKLSLSFINIVQGDVVGAYQRAVAEQNQAIIGPLNKINLQQLVNRSSITVPTIALNRLPDNSKQPPLLYQFALSPDDEAQQIAIAAWQRGHHHALVIAPVSSWGNKLATTFSNQFSELGGKVNGQIIYQTQKNLSRQVMQLLNIDKSYARRNTVRSLLGKAVRFVPRRRQDFDMVFIVAPPTIARQIQPLLKYYYAGNMPIYATSVIYSGTPAAQKDQDLNGITFCDMPWLLEKNQQLPPKIAAIRSQVKKDWPSLFASKPRLFALGVDSYFILHQINRFNLLRHSDDIAATGHLSLQQNRQVYRSLPLAYFKKGRPKLAD